MLLKSIITMILVRKFSDICVVRKIFKKLPLFRLVKNRWLIAAICIGFGFLLTAAFTGPGESDYDHHSRLLSLRKIAHLTLLQAGDLHSPVPPVVQTTPASFTISFHGNLRISPDSLVTAFDRSLSGIHNASGYLVEVRSCASGDVVYGFEIAASPESSNITCLGRDLPNDCYQIDVIFPETEKYGQKPVLAVISGLLFLLFLSAGSFPGSGKSTAKKPADQDMIRIGSLVFHPTDRLILHGDDRISLTARESEILKLFALNQETIISREKLEKDVWESKGVITGRSLDVFISRLRKKLSRAPEVSLTNVHGVGYKLTTRDQNA